MSTISSFKSKENKHDAYRGSACMKNHTIKINNFKKKKMKLLTNEQQKSHGNAKKCYIFAEKFEVKYAQDKKYGNTEVNISSYRWILRWCT